MDIGPFTELNGRKDCWCRVIDRGTAVEYQTVRLENGVRPPGDPTNWMLLRKPFAQVPGTPTPVC